MKEHNNDLIDGFLYPHYERIARFIPGRVTPNQLTITGFLFGFGASLILVVGSGDIKFLLASLFLYLWSLFDSLDGIHARCQGSATEFGAFLDHFLDAVAVLFLYTAALYAFNIQQIVFILTLAFRLLISVTTYILSTYTQELYLPKIGPTCEQYIFILFLVVSYFYPGNVILFENDCLFLKELTAMPGISIMGMAMFILFLMTPFTVYEHYTIAKKRLR